MELQLIDICDEHGEVLQPALLVQAEAVHRQLRTRIPQDYVPKLKRVFHAGARMTVALKDGKLVALAVWRHFEDTHDGFKFYVDDLVTDEAHRGQGIGSALIALLCDKAKAGGAAHLVLDVGVQRHETQRFCFRERFSIISHSFKKPLS
ncbi:GNAT family N-acetyltransferase [Viridibacterium curvum]